MRPLAVRGISLGEGLPKIVVPVMGVTTQQVLQSAEAALEAGADMLEWRADYLDTTTEDAICSCLEALRTLAGEVPILFTLRSVEQGGKSVLEPDESAAIIAAVANLRLADIIDIEYLHEQAEQLVAQVQNASAIALVSHHNFQETPSFEDIYSMYDHALACGADIAKVALFAQNDGDELRLMAATNDYATSNPDALLVGIAMGEKGTITRVAGEFFGSVLTFCSAAEASAPGQLGVAAARSVIMQLHSQSSQ